VDWITGITRLALGRPAVVFLVTLMVIVAGVFAVLRLKTELFPDIDFPVVTVATSYPGASPSSVLEDVTIPIENAVAGIGGLEELHSISTENLSVATAEFDYGTDMDRVEDDIEASVNNLALPTGAGRPSVNRFDFSDIPVVFFSLKGDREVSELETVARRDVVPAVERVGGVAQVAIEGTAAERVEVTLNPQKLSQYELTTQQVVDALQENNVSRPSGIIFDDEGRVLPVRTTSLYTSLQDISNLAIGSSEAASPVLLSDIGQVQMTTDPFASISRTDGQPSLSISVTKEADANTVEVANNVQDKVNEIRLPAGVEMVTIFDQSDYIEESIAALLREGALGFFFAVIVIYLFLTGLRTTLVTAVSIPLSIIIALIVLAQQGITLNLITMAGLTVAIGRVVDDSIVVLENIYRHGRAGEKLSEAAYTATREVGTAVFASTLTTVAVFLPLALAGGLVGEIFLSFALTITIALLASLVVALTIVPVLARYLLPVAGAQGSRPGWLGRLLAFGAGQPRPSPGDGEEEETWLQRIYTPILRWVLAHRLATLTAGIVLFVGSFALLPFIGVSFLPGGGGNTIQASVELPPGTSLATTEAKAQEIEKLLEQSKGLDTYDLVIGQPDPSGTVSQFSFGRLPTSGTIDMWLSYSDGVDMDEEVDWLRQELNALPGDKDVSVEQMSGSAQSDQVDITITADSLEDLRDANDQLLENLKDVEDLANVSSDLVSARPEIEVQVDSQKASSYGLSAQDVSQEVKNALFGQKATQAQLDGRTTDVYVRVAYDGSGTDEGTLNLLPFLPLAPGGTPTLDDVATLDDAESQVQVSRVDQRQAATIYGTITSDDLRAVSGKVDDAIGQVEKAPGVEIKKGGIFEEQEEAFGSLYIVLAFAVLVVYIVMVASLGSLMNPLIIMVSLPFATIGSFFALFITQREIGLPAMIGFLMLIGIVVTNAIVLITFVEQQRARGLPTREALIQSGRARARPILMTAVATIFALVPLSLGLNEGVLIAAELGTVVIGGLFTSTILTLLVIPVVYSLVDQGRSRLRGQPPEG
jgi:HAE1 family hydrophobic/amphiphilic exporter-1